MSLLPFRAAWNKTMAKEGEADNGLPTTDVRFFARYALPLRRNRPALEHTMPPEKK